MPRADRPDAQGAVTPEDATVPGLTAAVAQVLPERLEREGNALVQAHGHRRSVRAYVLSAAALGAAAGAAGAAFDGVDFFGYIAGAGALALVAAFVGWFIARARHATTAIPWVAMARTTLLRAASDALRRSGALPKQDDLLIEDPASARFDAALTTRLGVLPPSHHIYLEEAGAGVAHGLSYCWARIDYLLQFDPFYPDPEGLCLDIRLPRRSAGLFLVTRRDGKLARTAHNWFAAAHPTARDIPASGLLGPSRAQATASAAALEWLPASWLERLGALLADWKRPDFILAGADDRLAVYIEGAWLTGEAEDLERAVTSGEGLQEITRRAASRLAQLHRLVAALSAALGADPRTPDPAIDAPSDPSAPP